MTDFPGLHRCNWQLPAGVQAFYTTRHGGHSGGGCASFNLALHVNDDPVAVEANRELLSTRLASTTGMPVAIQWLQQVHGTAVFAAGQVPVTPPQADACVCGATGIALGVLTADCVPVLFCAADASEVAVAHAGWRGLLNGVLEATLAAMRSPASSVHVWLGPAIGPCHFEVGDEVRAAFLARAAVGERNTVAAAFAPAGKAGKWLGDLYALARLRLDKRGVREIAGETLCTVCHADRFYSYRHQPDTGRFATLILKTV